MKVKFPDYNNCITNIPNSILKYFGNEEGRKTSSLLDSYLKKEYDNVVVLLLDGMGKCIIDGNLDKEGFFQSHLEAVYSSTFPPTTVAATTSMLSGMNPCEHGWLGWDCYFPQINKNVTVFLNKEMETGLSAADYNEYGKKGNHEFQKSAGKQSQTAAKTKKQSASNGHRRDAGFDRSLYHSHRQHSGRIASDFVCLIHHPSCSVFHDCPPSWQGISDHDSSCAFRCLLSGSAAGRRKGRTCAGRTGPDGAGIFDSTGIRCGVLGRSPFSEHRQFGCDHHSDTGSLRDD